MLKKQYRITNPKDFERINKTGKQIGNQYIIIKFLKNELDYSRIGFIISNRISKKAVERNKIKRQLREISRLSFDQIPAGYDIVVYVKTKILTIDFGELQKTTLSTYKKIT